MTTSKTIERKEGAKVRTASAVWQGDLRTGKGTLTAPSGAFTGIPYSFATRFENRPGTNPEELIAAAHSGCYAMALSGELAKAGFKAERLEATAEVTLETVDGKPTVSHSHLRLKARVPGVEKAQFETLANAAKAGCPISRLLKAEISLEAILEA